MLTLDTTVLELLELHPETEEVFERYTRRLGICICCEALFCTLQELTLRYQLDSEALMARLSRAMDSHQSFDRKNQIAADQTNNQHRNPTLK